MLAPTLLIITIVMSGWWSVIGRRPALPREQVAELVVLLVIGMAALASMKPLIVWCTCLTGYFALNGSKRLFDRIGAARFRVSFIEYLDRVILEMKSGRGFRQALQAANEFGPLSFRERMTQIISIITVSKTSQSPLRDPFLNEVMQELHAVDRTTNKSLQRLMSYRRKISLEEEFKRKSHQATLRIKIQAWVMSILFIFLSAGASMYFGFHLLAPWLTLAAPLFLIGTLWIAVEGKNLRWKL